MLLNSGDNSRLLQSTGASKQHEHDVMLGRDPQRFKSPSAFRALTETCPDTAESSHWHSTAGCEDHARRNCSRPTRNIFADVLLAKSPSSSIAEVSSVCTDMECLGLYDVEPGVEISVPADDATEQSLRETDAARLNCVVVNNYSLATAASKSDDAFDLYHQLPVNNGSFDSDNIIGTEQVCSSVCATEAAVSVEDCSSGTVSVSNIEMFMPTNPSVLDSVRHPQRASQLFVDQGSGITELDWRQTVNELDRILCSAATPDECGDDGGIVCDVDVPEIPLFQDRVTPGGALQSVDQQLAHLLDAGRCGISSAGEASGRQVAETGATAATELNTDLASIAARVPVDDGSRVVEHPAEDTKDLDVDVCDVSESDQTVDAFRRAEMDSGPLDLTCGRTHSDNDTAVATAADVAIVASQEGISKSAVAYGASPMNVCNYHASHMAMSDCCAAGWSMVQTASSYSVGWSPHGPHPCYGHPGAFPGGVNPAPPPSMFPGSVGGGRQWWSPFCGPRARSRGTRTRRRPAPNSCSRVDGIRSTKVPAAGGEPSRTKDATDTLRPATAVPDQEMCSFSREVSRRPSSTSSANSVFIDIIAAESTSVPTSSSLNPAPYASDHPSVGDSQLVGDNSSVCENTSVVSTPFVGGNPYVVVDATATDAFAAVATMTSSFRSRGGGVRRGRTRGRAPRNSTQRRRRSSPGGGKQLPTDYGVQLQTDDGSQPPPARGRKRGRPRKYRGDAPEDRRRAARVQRQRRNDVDGILSPSVDADVVALLRRDGRPRSRRRRKTTLPTYAAVDSSAPTSHAVADWAPVVEQTRETLDFAARTTSAPPVVACEDRAIASQADGHVDDYSDVDVVGDTTDGDDLLTSAMGLADLPVVEPGASTTAAHHQHHFPLLPLPTDDELPSDQALYGRPVAVSGAIIRRPRSRKQGCRVPLNAAAEGPGTHDAGPDDDGEGPQASSWQPLVTESAISSLLDTLSVAAASDGETPETMLTSCDMRLQTCAATPFATLKRADLSRCVVAHTLYFYCYSATSVLPRHVTFDHFDSVILLRGGHFLLQ